MAVCTFLVSLLYIYSQNSPLMSLLYCSGFSSPLSDQTQPTMRPALTPFSNRSQTLTRFLSVPPEERSLSGSRTSSRPGIHLSIHNKELIQSSMDSSGYSSSEGPNRNLIASASSSNSTVSDSGQVSTASYRNRISSAFITLIGKYRGCINQ